MDVLTPPFFSSLPKGRVQVWSSIRFDVQVVLKTELPTSYLYQGSIGISFPSLVRDMKLELLFLIFQLNSKHITT